MILPSAKTYLATTSSIRQAHLIEIELAGEDGVFDYLTDFMSELRVGGKTYAPGKVISVGDVQIDQGLKNYQLSVKVAGEFESELNKGTTEVSYEGRRLIVYRAYLDQGGNVIPFDSVTNGPSMLFRGSISMINIAENVVQGASTITWSCVGKLADFDKVNGRLTEDSSHRGLVSSGINTLPVPSSGAKKFSYRTDTGFQHANQTVSTSIKYLSKETEYYLKKSWGGLRNKLKEREIEVERQVNLSTSLSALFLPAVYGVHRVPGIPVFLDVSAADPSKATVVYAVCEGEIEAFLNIYVDGVSALCGSSIEASTSGVCMGNAQNGDTLSVYTNTARSTERQSGWQRYKYDRDGLAQDEYERVEANPGVPPGPVPPSRPATEGTKHGDVINIAAEKGAIKLTFYHGTSDQLPNPDIVNTAAVNGFLIQRALRRQDGSAWGADYWKGASAGVSGSALLDTAYVVATFSMSEDRETIPNIEFVVSGRKCKVYTTVSSYTEKKTLNPVWQLLDYLTNPIFGAGLDVAEIDLASFISVANKLDIQDTSYLPSYVKYWKYIGWDSPSGNTAIMQCNTVLKTEDPVTKVVETLLQQFDGTLAIIDGIYSLSVETDDAPVAHIDITDIKGAVAVKDQANKDKWNSINASIVDPAMDWSTNQINFFNSTYLAQDNNIPKKGRALFNYITNYYTARAWAERQLNKSRFSKGLTFTTYYKFSFLKPNDNITLTYPRFNYNAAKFRVVSVNNLSDGSVRLSIERYESSIYNISGQSQTAPVGPVADEIYIPKNIGHKVLPDVAAPVTFPEDGSIYAIAYWDTGTNDIIRYDVDITNTSKGTSTRGMAPISDTLTIGALRNYFMFPVIAGDSYTFRAQSITNSGTKGPYGVYSFTVPSGTTPSAIPKVSGFKATNVALDGSFTGPNLQLQWETLPLGLETVPTYTIEIREPSNLLTVFSITVPNTPLVEFGSYSFNLVDNMAGYFSLNSVVGAYRALSPRIRANGTSGNFSEWSEITND